MKLVSLLTVLTLWSASSFAELTAAQKFQLNGQMGPVAHGMQLGTLLAPVIGSNACSAALSADNQAVTVTGCRMVTLTSDDATAANRTFTISQAANAGAILVLNWQDTDEGQLADGGTSGTGAVRLNSAWEPTNPDSELVLISDGTDWIELSRIAN